MQFWRPDNLYDCVAKTVRQFGGSSISQRSVGEGMTVQLSALDFSPVFRDQIAADSLWATVELAPALEQMGYKRFWIGEHHSPRVAHSSPQILASILAGVTDSIRIGVAGVLLNLHSPLRIAKDFAFLNALYHGRIDLGIARGGADGRQTELLRDGAPITANFPSRVGALQHYLSGEEGLVSPRNVLAPPIWMLGSGTESASIAANIGSNFCFALFLAHTEASLHCALDTYRSALREHGSERQPEICIAVAGVCAATEARAREIYLAESPVSVRHAILGDPAMWRRYIRDISTSTGVSEFVVLDLCRSFDARRESYRLLADALIDYPERP
jgi:luciferase family oxidoreductase group 1